MLGTSPRTGFVALCLLALLCGWTVPAQAGPWTREGGSHYVKLGQSVFVADGFRDANGTFNADTTYMGLNTFAYGEVGLTRFLQTQFYLPYSLNFNFFDEGSSLSESCLDAAGHPASASLRAAPGDALIGLQASTPWIKLPHAVRFNAKIPMYDVTQPGGACANLFAQPGDGQLDFELWFSLGESFHPKPFYLYGELGHRSRTEVFIGPGNDRSYAETFLFFGQAGWSFMEEGFLMFNLNVSVPYRFDDFTKGSVALGPALYLPTGKGWAFEATLEATVWARNASQGQASSLFITGGSLGLSHRH